MDKVPRLLVSTGSSSCLAQNADDPLFQQLTLPTS